MCVCVLVHHMCGFPLISGVKSTGSLWVTWCGCLCFQPLSCLSSPNFLRWQGYVSLLVESDVRAEKGCWSQSVSGVCPPMSGKRWVRRCCPSQSFPPLGAFLWSSFLSSRGVKNFRTCHSVKTVFVWRQEIICLKYIPTCELCCSFSTLLIVLWLNPYNKH